MNGIRTEKKNIDVLNTEYGEIRTIELNDEIWFILVDIAKVLGVHPQSIYGIPKNSKKIRITDWNNSPTFIINKSDLLKICQERVRISEHRRQYQKYVPVAEYLISKFNLSNIHIQKNESINIDKAINQNKEIKINQIVENLTVVENNEEFIPIYETDTGEKVVSGRELHQGLGVQSDFSHWIKNSLNCVDATEKDFYKHVFKDELSRTGQTKIEYILKLEIAKEICLVAGASPRANDFLRQKSKAYRKYLIQFEEKYKNQLPKLTEKQMLQLQILNGSDLERVGALEKYEKLIQEPLIKEIEEKDTIIDTAIKDDALFDVGVIGKLLKPYCKKMGERKIFDFLQENKILKDKPGTQKHNNPYDKYNKYFEMKTSSFDKGGYMVSYIKTYFNGRGLKWFLKKLAREGYIQKSEIKEIADECKINVMDRRQI